MWKAPTVANMARPTKTLMETCTEEIISGKKCNQPVQNGVSVHKTKEMCPQEGGRHHCEKRRTNFRTSHETILH